MASQEERMLILKMIDEGKISADEGARLLSAVQAGGDNVENESAQSSDGQQQEPSAGASTSGQKAGHDADSSGRRSSGTATFGDSFQSGFRINVENVDMNESSLKDGDSLASTSGGARNIRVRVSDPETKQEHVDVNLPLKIIEFGLRFVPETDDERIENFRSAVYNKEQGPIFQVKGGDEAARVEVSLE